MFDESDAGFDARRYSMNQAGTRNGRAAVQGRLTIHRPARGIRRRGAWAAPIWTSRQVLARSGGVLVSVVAGLTVGLLFGCLAGALAAVSTGAWEAVLGWAIHFGWAGMMGGALVGVGASLCGADPWLD